MAGLPAPVEDLRSEGSPQAWSPSVGPDLVSPWEETSAWLDAGALSARVQGSSQPGGEGENEMEAWMPQGHVAAWPHSSLTADRWPLQTFKPGQTD